MKTRCIKNKQIKKKTYYMILIDYKHIHVDIFLIDMRCLLCKSSISIVTKPCTILFQRSNKKKKIKNDRKKTDSIRVMEPRYRLPRLNSLAKRIKNIFTMIGISIWIESGQLERESARVVYIVDESA